MIDRLPLAALRVAGRMLPDGLPGAQQLGRAVLTSVFGPPQLSTDRDPGDRGLAGPGSASWQVLGDPASIAGGVRALLLQLTHPLAMAGVADHSRFRDDPLGRLHGTSAYVTTTTFGSTREALAVTRRVRALHAQVRGTAPDGRPYAASDPHLLAWVSVTLTSSFLAADRLWAPRPVTGARADAFVAEQSRIAALLDPRVDLNRIDLRLVRDGNTVLPLIAEGGLPQSVEELERVLADFDAELEVGDQGRAAVRFLRKPPIPLYMAPGYQLVLAGALGSLRPHVRRLLGLWWPQPLADAAVVQTGAGLAALRLTTGTSPSISAAEERAAS